MGEHGPPTGLPEHQALTGCRVAKGSMKLPVSHWEITLRTREEKLAGILHFPPVFAFLQGVASCPSLCHSFWRFPVTCGLF